MTKGARHRGRSRGGSAGRLPARRAGHRLQKSTILILGEGRETEPNYFRGLKEEESVTARFAVTVKKGSGKSPEEAVKKAIEENLRAKSRGEDYDQVWCVLDVEQADQHESLRRARATAERNGITLCLSNPSFEIWFLAHFERTARPFNGSDAVVVQLNKHWKKHCGQAYEKNDEQVYNRVSGFTERALNNARWVREKHHEGTDIADANSSTEVYRLVGKLLAR